MTDIELKMKKHLNYVPQNTTKTEYCQVVYWVISGYGDNCRRFVADTLKELSKVIKDTLKHGAKYGTVSNIKYGPIYTRTTTTEYKEFLLKVNA